MFFISPSQTNRPPHETSQITHFPQKVEELNKLCSAWLNALDECSYNQLKKHAGLFDKYHESTNIIEKINDDLSTERQLREKLGIDQEECLGSEPISGRYFRKFVYPEKTDANELYVALKKYQPLKLFVENNQEFKRLVKQYAAVQRLKNGLDVNSPATELLNEFATTLYASKNNFDEHDKYYEASDYILQLESKDPFYLILNQVMTLPDFDIADSEADHFFVELGLQLMNRESYDKNDANFLQDVKAILAELKRVLSKAEMDALKKYVSLLRNSDFFIFFQAINASITLLWNALHVNDKLPGEEKYLSGDDMPILLKKLLPNDLSQLKELNTKLSLLAKVCNLRDENAYSIIVLATAVKDKIDSLSLVNVSADEKKKETLINPVISRIHTPAFSAMVDTFVKLIPIKQTCQEYNDALVDTLDALMRKNASLYQRFKYNEETVGIKCLLKIDDIVAGIAEDDPALKEFAAYNPKFTLTLQKYQALMRIRKHFVENAKDPHTALRIFQMDFKENLATFKVTDKSVEHAAEGPCKRFVKRIFELLSNVFAPCMQPRLSKTPSTLFINRISSFFPVKSSIDKRDLLGEHQTPVPIQRYLIST